MTIRVLVVDDQEMVRAGLGMILGAQPDIDVVGEASDGAEAIAATRDLDPDVVLMDIRMPGIDGISATRAIVAQPTPVAVLIITTFDLDEYVFSALKAGAQGFILKDANGALVVEAVRAAAAGETLISPKITTRLLAHFATQGPADENVRQPVEALTDREEQVLAALALGLTNAEIGDELHISLSTVKSHVNTLLTKLAARNRVELAIWAHETGRIRTT